VTQIAISTAAAGARDLGLVGARQLHAVQLLDIGRLTYHVVPFVPGTFVAISGRGPRGDSNETGKTTFLAATSLLLGDAEWRLRSGGQHAATLLFNPHAVGAAEHLADPADHGYIIGLFAQAGEPPTDPLSIWLRINRASPYLELKAQFGQTFVDPDGARPAPLEADDLWAQMTHLGGARPLGASSFVEALYGNTPRCIAHLTKRGDLPSGVSLLNTNAGSFNREQIGAALVALASRQDILDDDRSQRGELEEAERRLHQRTSDATEREREYERQLSELDGRDHARQLLTTAQRDWESHDAHRFVAALDARTAKQDEQGSALKHKGELEQAVDAAASAVAAISDDQALRKRHADAVAILAESDQRYEATVELQLSAEQTVTSLRNRLRDLRAQASHWQGPSPEQTEPAERDARANLTAAEQRAAILGAAVESAQDLLARAREGRGDATAALDTLRSAGITAQSLLDAVTIEPSEGPTLEPLLWPYRDAVVIADDHLASAIEALADQHWAMLISGPGEHPVPTGITAYPEGAGHFLTQLAARASLATSPNRASDTELGVTVIGASTALAGRHARIRAATRRLEEAEAAHATADGACQAAVLTADARSDDHQRATAAAEALTVEEQLTTREQELDRARNSRAAATTSRDAAQAAAREIAVQVAGLDAARERAASDHTRATTALTEQQAKLDKMRDELQTVNDAISAAEKQWGHGEKAARERCQEDNRDEGRLRNAANDALNEALYALGMRRDQDWAPTDDLIEAWRRRREDENTTPFPILAEPLDAYLDEFSDRDIVLRERIEADRRHTAEALEAAEIEVTQTKAALARIQDAIETSIESAIAAIEQEFDRLDQEAGGYGAKLELETRPPVDAADNWHWSVTPMWRRSPDGRMVPYTAPTNSAQDKLYTVNLVLAALLAVPNPEGRVLILDELGDSLGFEHRREMLRAIAATAHAKAITVLGTCQDDVLHHAADFTQEIVFFEYADNRDLLNRPARLFGYDPQGARIELTREAVLRGRPLV
jgi:hypothetical protein